MNNTIVKTFIGKHIDLSKVVLISNAEFTYRMGYGGWFVSFEIYIQLLDNPIVYTRPFELDEYKFNEGYGLVYGNDGKTPLAIERLQTQINELIEQWREVKNDNHIVKGE